MKGYYSIKMMIGSIITGFLYFLIGEVIYNLFNGQLPRVVVTMFYFVGMFLFVGLCIFLIQNFLYSRAKAKISKKQYILLFLAIIAGSLLFEFLYDLSVENEQQEINSYVFVIDNSGSMSSNDEQGVRYQALEKIIASKEDEFEYAIYNFSNQATLVREFLPKSRAIDYEIEEDNGGTAIRGTFSTILDDINNGTLPVKAGCRIIFLSDGAAGDINIFNKHEFVRILDKFYQKGISISTIGFLYADDDLMSMIAEKTGGVFISISDVDDLEAAMVEAQQAVDSKHNLLGYRNNISLSWLYGIMRVVFITILGMIIAFVKTVICEKFIDTSSVLKSSLLGGILAGVFIEIGMNIFGFSPVIVRAIVCILIAFTLLRQDLYYKSAGNNEEVIYS